MVEYETDNNVFAAKAQIATALSQRNREALNETRFRVCVSDETRRRQS